MKSSKSRQEKLMDQEFSQTSPVEVKLCGGAKPVGEGLVLGAILVIITF
jgi:hypothetical protein